MYRQFGYSELNVRVTFQQLRSDWNQWSEHWLYPGTLIFEKNKYF